MPNMRVSTVWLDLGDTLVRLKPSLMNDSIRQIEAARGRAVKRKRDFDQARVKFDIACNQEWAEREHEIRMVQTTDQERDYWPIYFDAVLRRLGAANHRGELSQLLARRQADPQSFECFPDVVETLEQLQARHFVLGIVSNAFPSAQKIMNHLKLLPCFKHLVFSHEVNCSKPEPEIYQYAVDCAHIPMARAVFVDDRPRFVTGARAAGMPAVLLDRDGQYNHKDWGGARIGRLPDLLQLIEPILDDEVRCGGQVAPRLARNVAWLVLSH
jgi:HAD superfamily hydrolase (TIGR01509 family)